jgi:hypothetical protein
MKMKNGRRENEMAKAKKKNVEMKSIIDDHEQCKFEIKRRQGIKVQQRDVYLFILQKIKTFKILIALKKRKSAMYH